MSTDVERLLEAVESLQRRVDGLEGQVAELHNENVELRKENKDLRRQVKEWEEGYRWSRSGRRKKKKARKKEATDGDTSDDGEEKRRSGRRKGHAGAGRAGPAKADRTVECRSTTCGGCGGDALDDLRVGYRHTVEDLVITVVTTQYLCMRQRCETCGEEQVAPLPPELGGAPKIGPVAQAVGMSLRYDYGLTVGKISDIFSGILGLPFSAGGLSQMFDRNLSKCAPAVNEIWASIASQPIIFVDETRWPEDGAGRHLWGVSNDQISVFAISESRDRETFHSMVSTSFPGIIATDAYVVYDHIPEERHPQCWAHVLRTTRDVAAIHEDRIDIAMYNAVRSFMGAAGIHRNTPGPHTRAFAAATFEAVIAAGRHSKHKDLNNLADRLDRQRIRYLLCLDNPIIPLTTNRIEGDLRPAVIARKNSFGTRNEWGSNMWANGMTLAQTLRKQGSSLLSYLPSVLAAATSERPLPSVFA